MKLFFTALSMLAAAKVVFAATDEAQQRVSGWMK